MVPRKNIYFSAGGCLPEFLKKPKFECCLFVCLFIHRSIESEQRGIDALKMFPANGESRRTSCSSPDMPLLLSGFLGRGCQEVSKSFPGRKGGATLLGIYPPEEPAHVWKDIHTWLFMAALLIGVEFWNPHVGLERVG